MIGISCLIFAPILYMTELAGELVLPGREDVNIVHIPAGKTVLIPSTILLCHNFFACIRISLPLDGYLSKKGDQLNIRYNLCVFCPSDWCQHQQNIASKAFRLTLCCLSYSSITQLHRSCELVILGREYTLTHLHFLMT